MLNAVKGTSIYCVVLFTLRKYQGFLHCNDKIMSVFQQLGVFHFITGIHVLSNPESNNV